MSSLKFDTYTPSYLIQISDAVYIGDESRYLLMNREDRKLTINAYDRIIKRIRNGNIVKVTVRKKVKE